MTLPLLIGIAGKDGTGKSTLAKNLAADLGDAFLMAFATKLRQMCVVDGYLSRYEAHRKPTTPYARQVLREKSNHYKKLFGSEYFAESGRRKWSQLRKLNYPVLVHDLRYLAEAKAIHSDGGVIVFLGNNYLTPDERKESSFADLPKISEMADHKLPKWPANALVSGLFMQLLKEA